MKEKNKLGTLMEQAHLFVQMREEFLFTLAHVEDDESIAMVDEMIKVIRSRNSTNHFALTVFLNAICSTSPKRLSLMKWLLEKRNPRFFRRLKKIGFRESTLRLND